MAPSRYSSSNNPTGSQLIIPLTVAALYGFATTFGTLFVRRRLYPVPGIRVDAPPEGFSEVLLPLPRSGATAVGWRWDAPGRRPGDPVALFFHGNCQNLELLHRDGLLQRLCAFGVSFLVIDYPGYGKSTGEPCEASLVEAADQAVDWAVELAEGGPVIAVGWSLGAAVAIQTAARHPGEVRGLIALSPWTTLQELAHFHFSWFSRLLRFDPYDSLGATPRIGCRTLIIHGLDDGVIPSSHGARIAGALGEQARLLELDGLAHEDLADDPRVWSEVAAYFAALTAVRPAARQLRARRARRAAGSGATPRRRRTRALANDAGIGDAGLGA